MSLGNSPWREHAIGQVKHQPEQRQTLEETPEEITKIKIEAGDTGIFMLGGGVPKNFTQDIVVAAEILEKEVSMHKYAVQITVADERDGALSGSTLKEASSWGKVETTFEQMVFSEVTIALPLIASYTYHKADRSRRTAKHFNDMLNNQ